MTVDTLMDSMPVSELFTWFRWYSERDEDTKKAQEPNAPVEHDWENMESSSLGEVFNL